MEALKMEPQMDNWNDDRLDELSRTTKEGFAEVKGDLRDLNSKFDRLQHTLMVGGISFGIALFTTLGGLLVTQV